MAAASNIAIGQQQQCANLSLRIFLCNMLSLYLFYYISILFFNLILISQLITFGSCKQHRHRPATMQCANLSLRIFLCNKLSLYLFHYISILFFNLILISQLITFGSCNEHHHRPTATMQCANLSLRIFFCNMLWLYLFWHIYLLTEYCRSNNQNQILKLKIFNTLLTYWKKYIWLFWER